MNARTGILIPVALSVVLIGVNLACESPVGRMRATTFPEDLTYLSPSRLKTSMWVLAAEIQELERLLESRTERDAEAQRLATTRTLERMRVAARTLENPGRSTQHPVLNQNLGLFIERLDRAERALDRDPPDYFPASTLAGSCYLCHGRIRATARQEGHPEATSG